MTHDSGLARYLIESYDFGCIVVDGVTYTSDVMISGEKVEANWWRKEGHALQVSDLEDAMERFAPEIVIIGTGYMGMMKVPKETREYFQSKGVDLHVEKTTDACSFFNSVSRSKRTLACLHLTC